MFRSYLPGLPEMNADPIRRLAARTVAHYANDPQDCAALLDMLGLRDEDPAPPAPAPVAPAAVCACGHLLLRKGAVCTEYVPIGPLRTLVERIRRDTGMHPAQIARGVGLFEPSFATTLRRGRRVRCSTYTAVAALAEKLSIEQAPTRGTP